MQKASKNIILLSIIGIVLFQTLIDILNFYNNEINEIRRNCILNNEIIVKTKIFPLTTWTSFDSKKEIKINGTHFDVIDFSIKNNNVIVKVYEDNFEDELNFILKKIKDPKGKNDSGKKKLIKQLYIFCKLSIPNNQQIVNKQENYNKIKVLKCIGKTFNIKIKNFKPPCLIS